MTQSSYDAGMRKALGFVLPAAVVLLGLVLRLYRIDWQSVWYDEAFPSGSCCSIPGTARFNPAARRQTHVERLSQRFGRDRL